MRSLYFLEVFTKNTFTCCARMVIRAKSPQGAVVAASRRTGSRYKKKEDHYVNALNGARCYVGEYIDAVNLGYKLVIDDRNDNEKTW
jgi:hypothetical protein